MLLLVFHYSCNKSKIHVLNKIFSFHFVQSTKMTSNFSCPSWQCSSIKCKSVYRLSFIVQCHYGRSFLENHNASGWWVFSVGSGDFQAFSPYATRCFGRAPRTNNQNARELSDPELKTLIRCVCSRRDCQFRQKIEINLAVLQRQHISN